MTDANSEKLAGTPPAGRSLTGFRRDQKGRLAGIDGTLTPRQRLFVAAYVDNGGVANAAAIVSGYSCGSTASQLLSLPHVQAAIRDRRLQAIDSIACQAVGTLREVMADKLAPASAKVQAARLALALAGHTEKTGDGPGAGAAGAGVPLESMTVEALEEFVKAGAAAVSRLRPVLTIQAADSAGFSGP